MSRYARGRCASRHPVPNITIELSAVRGRHRLSGDVHRGMLRPTIELHDRTDPLLNLAQKIGQHSPPLPRLWMCCDIVLLNVLLQRSSRILNTAC
jgi:hypothetical protein